MKLSVITICRDAGEGLRDTVASVLDQSRRPFEYRIQDGASSDGSLARMIDWLVADRGFPPPTDRNVRGEPGEMPLQAGGSRLIVRSEPDNGIYDALNRAIRQSTGDGIGLLHAGDTYAHPDVLAEVARAFRTGAEAVYGDLRYVRARGSETRVARHWRSGAYDRGKLKWGWMPPHPALFLRREVYERAALADGVYFDPSFRCAGDYDFVLRALPGLRVPPVYLSSVLVHMRMGGISNRSVRHILRKSAEDWRAIRRNRAGGPCTLLAKNLRKMGQFRVCV